MEGSISSDYGGDDPDFGIFCFCGEPAPLTKSTTQSNPGRRFFGCANFKVRFWYEPNLLIIFFSHTFF
ncbi:hypothetical protein RHGRI_015566 [Rhododendron griersonianum]|uniref:Zinc finger GRF-type domain-containing protein n=1 Tax=Rhododendron griersonianum TaxID=479676 RepID=A0AAV6KDS6_9ERIC|nr:hypothetical protein RHGRI_015566 [Rhododendron griersonianum]